MKVRRRRDKRAQPQLRSVARCRPQPRSRSRERAEPGRPVSSPAREDSRGQRSDPPARRCDHRYLSEPSASPRRALTEEERADWEAWREGSAGPRTVPQDGSADSDDLRGPPAPLPHCRCSLCSRVCNLLRVVGVGHRLPRDHFNALCKTVDEAVARCEGRQ
eukprot:8881239-Alexandrium_andersonii.AAC.1